MTAMYCTVCMCPITIRLCRSNPADRTGHTFKKMIEKYENDIKGIHLEPSAVRTYPYGTLAAQVIGFTG